jgi:hypothetical protein
VPTVPYRPLVSTQELVLLAASLVASLLAGALVAARFRVPTRLAAMVTAFGGGILVSSVALELVPDADEGAGIRLTAIGIAVGALIFVGADALLSRAETPRLVRRSRHAAAAGQPMPMPMPICDRMRPAESPLRLGSSSTECRSHLHWASQVLRERWVGHSSLAYWSVTWWRHTDRPSQ